MDSSCRLQAAVAATVILTAGCASLGKPKWLEPLTVKNQQRRAVRFDPFMENDIGPGLLRQYTTLDGTRPRDFADPVVEVKRSRWWSQPLR